MLQGLGVLRRATGQKGVIFQIWCQPRTDKFLNYKAIGTMWGFCWGVEKLYRQKKPRGRVLGWHMFYVLLLYMNLGLIQGCSSWLLKTSVNTKLVYYSMQKPYYPFFVPFRYCSRIAICENSCALHFIHSTMLFPHLPPPVSQFLSIGLWICLGKCHSWINSLIEAQGYFYYLFFNWRNAQG